MPERQHHDPEYAPDVKGQVIPFTIGALQAMQDYAYKLDVYIQTSSLKFDAYIKSMEQKTDAINRRTDVMEKQVEALQKAVNEQEKQSVKWVGIGVGISASAGIIWAIYGGIISLLGFLKHGK